SGARRLEKEGGLFGAYELLRRRWGDVTGGLRKRRKRWRKRCQAPSGKRCQAPGKRGSGARRLEKEDGSLGAYERLRSRCDGITGQSDPLETGLRTLELAGWLRHRCLPDLSS